MSTTLSSLFYIFASTILLKPGRTENLDPALHGYSGFAIENLRVGFVERDGYVPK